MKTYPDVTSRRAILLGIGFVASGAVVPPDVLAQEDGAGISIETPAVEVTAYRLPTLLSETTQGVSVITREQIEDRNPATAVDLMKDVPGVYVDQVGGPGGVASIHIRGSDPEHVLVLIDGVRVNDPMLSRGGSYDLSSLDLADVERIEVIRGSGSAIYGADAMGGVVNIVTRRGKGDGVTGSAGIEGGGQDYARAAGSISGGSDKVRFSANASGLRDGETEDGSTIDLKTFSGSLSYNPSDGNNVGLFARHNDRDSSSFPDFSGGILYAQDRTLEQRDATETVYGADVNLRPKESLDLKLGFSRYERDEDINSPGVAFGPNPPFFVPPSVSSTDFTRDTFLASALAQLPLDSELVLGYEYMDEDGVNDSVIIFPPFPLFPGAPTGPTPTDFSLDRKTDSVFAELKSVPVQDLTVQLGIRYDSPSDLASETSPSAGIRYDFVNTGTTLKAHYSEGFRPPSFFALGDPLVGNPDLQSETSKGYEIGLEQILADGKLRLNLNAFWTDYKNLIDYDPTIGPFGSLVNRGEVEIDGTEFGVLFQALNNLQFDLTYTYVKSDIVNSTDVLRNRPENKAVLSIRYFPTSAWRLAWTTLYVGEFFDSSVPTGDVTMDGYTLTDISAEYTRNRITLAFAIDNLFDEDYQEFVGFVNPGIRGRVGVSARF